MPAAERAGLRQVTVLPMQSGSQLARKGRLQRVLGTVESSGRMPQLLVAIDDPLGQQNGEQPLLLGTYVKVDLPGLTVENVFKIPRQALRPQNRVYVADRKSRLRIRQPEVVYSTDAAVLVRGDFQAGDRLVLSNLDTPLEGTRLEVIAE